MVKVTCKSFNYFSSNPTDGHNITFLAGEMKKDKPEIDINPLPADHDYSRFQSVLFVD